MIAATRKVLSLHIDSYAALLLQRCPTLEVENFNLMQRAHYCSSVIMGWIQAPRLREFIQRAIPGQIPLHEYTEQSVTVQLPDQLGEADHTQTIMAVAANFVNEWKSQFANRASKASPSEADLHNCEFFMKIIGEISFALLMRKVSQIQFVLPQLDNQAKAQALTYFLKEVCLPPVEQLTTGDDEFVNSLLHRYRWVQLLMLSAEEAMRQRFESGEERLGVGDLLLYFMELEKWLAPIMDNERCEGDDVIQRRVIVTLCQREPVYLKWNFLRVRFVMKKLTANEVKGIPISPVMGVLFSPEVRTACKRLKRWLGFRAKIKFYPPLERSF
jgi:hypothetical protein